MLAGSGLATPRGLSSADVVWVTFPSSSRARALAVFQSAAPTAVGPVASTRPSDGKLLPVTRAGLAYAGGPAGYVKQLGTLKIPQFSSVTHSGDFARASDGTLSVAVAKARSMSGLGAPRSGVLAFDPEVKPAAKARAVKVTVPGRAADTLTWSPTSGKWTGKVGGLPVSARNVIVQTVPYASIVIPRSGRQTEQNPTVFGTGSAVLMPAGAVVPGAWSRGGREATTGYTDTKSNGVRLSPGSTWVLLVPKGTTVR